MTISSNSDSNSNNVISYYINSNANSKQGSGVAKSARKITTRRFGWTGEWWGGGGKGKDTGGRFSDNPNKRGLSVGSANNSSAPTKAARA